MTSVYLVRHGATDAIGQTFTGRLRGVSLNQEGQAQAAALGRHFGGTPIAAVYASPSDRARETAAPIASQHRLSVESNDAFDEIDVGRWSGQSFDRLGHDPAFRGFNAVRSLSRPPQGELMLEVQSRAVSELLHISQRDTDRAIVVVSHADVIKAVLAYFLGIPLDLAYRLEIGLASVSIVQLSVSEVHVVAINRTA